MAFYHVINGGTFVGEKEVMGVIHWRPISWVTPLELGKRRYGVAGKRQVEIEIMNHDKAVIRVNWGEATLELMHHEHNDGEEIIDVGKTPLATISQNNDIESITLGMGTEHRIFKTSIGLIGQEGEEVRWTQNKEEPGGLF